MVLEEKITSAFSKCPVPLPSPFFLQCEEPNLKIKVDVNCDELFDDDDYKKIEIIFITSGLDDNLQSTMREEAPSFHIEDIIRESTELSSKLRGLGDALYDEAADDEVIAEEAVEEQHTVNVYVR